MTSIHIRVQTSQTICEQNLIENSTYNQVITKDKKVLYKRVYKNWQHGPLSFIWTVLWFRNIQLMLNPAKALWCDSSILLFTAPKVSNSMLRAGCSLSWKSNPSSSKHIKVSNYNDKIKSLLENLFTISNYNVVLAKRIKQIYIA